MRTVYKRPWFSGLNSVVSGFGAICLVMVLVTWYQLSKNYYGMFYGVFAALPKTGFSGVEFNHFQSINCWYFAVGTCLAVYLAGRFLGGSLAAVVVRLLALCISTYPFANMLMYKFANHKFFNEDWYHRYEWIEASIYLDIACLVLMAVITGLEIIKYLSRPRQAEQNFHLS
jgi:hypothetical protein